MADSGILILGAGGHARVVAALLAQTSRRVIGVLDKRAPRAGERIGVYIGIGTFDDLGQHYAAGVRHVALALGDNSERAAMRDRVRMLGFEVIGLRHPSAIVEPGATIATDAVLCANAVVCAEASVGSNTIVNTSAVIEHECRIGDHAHISSRVVLAGRVRVGEGTFVGVGSCVRDRVTIGAGVVVGAGAAVVSDLPDGVVAVGVPARVRPDLQSSWKRAS